MLLRSGLYIREANVPAVEKKGQRHAAKINVSCPHCNEVHAGTARRGMKTVESSAVFQPKQWAEKEARKTIENST